MNAIVKASDVDVDSLQRIGKMLMLSGYFEADRDSNRGIAQMCTKVLAGREMGFGPFASVNGIHIIQGKPAVGANLLASAVKASGRYDYRVRKMDATACELEFFEVGNGKRDSLGVSSFTVEEARKAGTKNLDKFPRNMLFARAMSNGVRWFCPDVFNGNAVYVPEELGAEVDGEGNVIDAGPVKVLTPPTNGNGSNGNHAPQPAAVDADFYDNPFTEQEQATNDDTPAWQTWESSPDAYAWAVAIGACANEFEAKGSMAKIVAAEGGKNADKARVFEAFYNRQNDKLAMGQ